MANDRWDEDDVYRSRRYGNDEDYERNFHRDREQENRGRGPRGYTRSDERIREDVSDWLMEDRYVDAQSAARKRIRRRSHPGGQRSRPPCRRSVHISRAIETPRA